MTTATAARRLPIGPLCRAVQLRCDLPNAPKGAHRPGGADGFTDRVLAAYLNVDRATVSRWRTQGMTGSSADRAACSIGLHPALVWGRAWWEAPL